MKKYFAKKSYYGRSFFDYKGKWKKDKDVKKQFGFLYRYFVVFLEKGKWKKLLANIHLVFGVYLLRFIVGLSYIFSSIKYEKR